MTQEESQNYHDTK
jgi:hypothetical protein